MSDDVIEVPPTVTALVVHAPGAVATRMDQNPVAVYLGRQSARSRKTMLEALGNLATMLAPQATQTGKPKKLTKKQRDQLALHFPWWTLEYQHTTRLRQIMLDRTTLPDGEGGMAPATANRHLSALRGVLKECWRLGLMTAEQRERACDLKNLKNKRLPAGRMLTGEEIAALFAATAYVPPPPQVNSGVRDSALLAIMYATGLRREEVVGLDLDDYRGADGERSILIRHGKGDKQRECPVSADAAGYLDLWLDERISWLKPDQEEKALFVNHHGRRLTAHSVAYILEKLAKRAGVAGFSPHDLRRTFISTGIDVSKDLFAVQRIVGHESPKTTSRYDRRGEKAKRDVVDLMKFPKPPKK